jgi:hypothetical protein
VTERQRERERESAREREVLFCLLICCNNTHLCLINY